MDSFSILQQIFQIRIQKKHTFFSNIADQFHSLNIKGLQRYQKLFVQIKDIYLYNLLIFIFRPKIKYMTNLENLKQQWLKNLLIIDQESMQLTKNDIFVKQQFIKKSSFQQINQIKRQQSTHQLNQHQISQYLKQTGLNLKINQSNRKDDQKQLYILLKYYLQYPIQELTLKHIQANVVGKYDIIQYNQKNNQVNQTKSDYPTYNHRYILGQSQLEQTTQTKQLCQCCSLPVSQKKIQFNIKGPPAVNMHILGASTSFFFVTQVMLFICITIMFLVYGIYSLSVNRMISQSYRAYLQKHYIIPTADSLIVYQGFTSFGLGSMIAFTDSNNLGHYETKQWLGCISLCVWFVLFLIVKIYFIKKQIKSKSLISTYTLLFSKTPYQYDINKLQHQIKTFMEDNLEREDRIIFDYIKQKAIRLRRERNYRNIESLWNQGSLSRQEKLQRRKSLQWGKLCQEQKRGTLGIIQKTNEARMLYYKQSNCFCCSNNEDQNYIKQMRNKLEKLIQDRLESQNFNQSQLQRQQLYQDYRDKLKIYCLKSMQNDYSTLQKIQQEIDKMYLYVTFTNVWIAQKFLSLHRKKIFKFSEQRIPKIELAPQPVDIQWHNLGQQSWIRQYKYIGSVFIAGLIIGGTFVFFILQNYYQEKGTFQQVSWYFPFIITLCIKAFEILLQKILYKLTKFECHKTYSNEQTRIATKAVLVSLFQSIVIPYLISAFINDNIFGRSGLPYIVLYLSIINSIQDLFWRMVDVFHPFERFITWIIKDKYHLVKLKYSQQQYNQAMLQYQTVQFQIGYEYVEVVRTFLFTCFYASLQPWVILLGMGNCIIMFYTRQWYLLRCKRPIPYSSIVHQWMHKFLMFGPFLFWLGTFFFTRFSDYYYKLVSIPNLIAFSISIGFIFGEIIVWFVRNYKQNYQFDPSIYYQNYANTIITDYDMVNPATSVVGCILKHQENLPLAKINQRNVNALNVLSNLITGINSKEKI